MVGIGEPRFDSKLLLDRETGCWLWQASKAHHGYGRYAVKSERWRMAQAHRYAYVAVRGTIPAGLSLDHLCRRPGCVNPDHLEPVTHKENVLRGNCPTAVNARKTHCPRGHEYTPENTSVRGHGRNCRTCHRIRASETYWARKNAERGTHGEA